MNDVEKAKYLLDKDGTMKRWYDEGLLNRRMKTIDLDNSYLPNNFLKKVKSNLIIVFSEILGREDEEGKVLKKHLTNWTQKTYKKHITANMKIVEETNEYYVIDYTDLWNKYK